MSRSGYEDDDGFDALAIGRWHGNVQRSLKSKRGQAFLRELLEALDAMPEKKLYRGSFATADGAYCTLGALGAKKGIFMGDLGDENYCDVHLVAARFGISHPMASEIMYMNDEAADESQTLVEVVICGPMRPCYPDYDRHSQRVWVENKKHAEDRFTRMRNWVLGELIEAQK